jgi:F-type H+-transporting ATPase subunit epsilon
MKVTVISPEQAVFDGEADSLVAPAFDGLVGILPGHAPFVTILGEGRLKVRNGSDIRHFEVSGGFLQVSGGVVRVVADRVTNS